MQTNLDSWCFYENAWQMEYEVLQNCSCKVHIILPQPWPKQMPITQQLELAHLNYETMTPRAMVSTGGWLQLWLAYQPQLCSACLQRKGMQQRDTHTLFTQRCWNSSCLGCKQTLSVSWGGRQCINKETDHRQQTNREEKSRNTIHGPGFSDTTIGKLTAYKHVQLLSSEEHVVQEKEFCIKQNWFKS